MFVQPIAHDEGASGKQRGAKERGGETQEKMLGRRHELQGRIMEEGPQRVQYALRLAVQAG